MPEGRGVARFRGGSAPAWLAALASFSGGCARYEAPWDGVAKGCVEVVEASAPFALGLGLSSHVPWGADEAAAASRAFEVGRWEALGIRIVRTDFTWSAIEPDQGAFDFTGPDRIVDAADSVGAEVIPILAYGNAWAGSAEEHAPPADVSAFGDYAAAVAARYGSRIARYEVWNEPNAGIRFWKPAEDPVAYAALLREAADRIHAVAPGAEVSLGGVFDPALPFVTPGLEFARAVFEAEPELPAQLDAFAFHPYRYPFTAPESRSDDQPSLSDEICAWRTLAEEVGAPEIPLWITEIGWHTAPDAPMEGISEAEQAAWLVRSAVIAFAHGVPLVAWYTLRDEGTDAQDQEDWFGLYGYDGDPLSEPEPAEKPSARALAVLAGALGERTRVEDRSLELGLDAATWAYGFSGGGVADAVGDGAVTVLWTTGEPVTVRIPGRGRAAVADLAGGEREVRARDGAYEVPIGTEPVFVWRVR